jgi:hypothetical protein
MAKTDAEYHHECMNRFIDLANAMKEEDIAPNVVMSAMMRASALYAMYAAGGNEAGFTPAGIDKVTAAYKLHLEQVVQAKKEQAKKEQAAQEAKSND